MLKIIIELEGGLIKAIHATEDCQIHILDHDNDSMSPEELEEESDDIFVPRSPDTVSPYIIDVLDGFSEKLRYEANFYRNPHQ